MKSCLVVDDSKMIRRVAIRIIKELKFEAFEANNGREALSHCSNAMPDAILLDWQMPEMDGLEFLIKLRDLPDGNKPIVVFCASERNPDRILEALDAGADEYIMKPFDSDIIESKLYEAGLMERA